MPLRGMSKALAFHVMGGGERVEGCHSGGNGERGGSFHLCIQEAGVGEASSNLGRADG